MRELSVLWTAFLCRGFELRVGLFRASLCISYGFFVLVWCSTVQWNPRHFNHWYANAVLSGGTTMFQGIAERIFFM